MRLKWVVGVLAVVVCAVVGFCWITFTLADAAVSTLVVAAGG